MEQEGSIMILVLKLPNCSEFHLFLCFILFHFTLLFFHFFSLLLQHGGIPQVWDLLEQSLISV